MEKYYIVIYRDNWADEFDIEAFQLFTEKEWLDATDSIDRSNDEQREIYFGTNEFIEISPKEFFRNAIITELSLSRYNLIKNIIGETFGTIFIEGMLENFGGYE